MVRKVLEPVSAKVISFQFPAGELHKTLDVVRDIYKELIEAHFDRKDYLAALGGGVVGDITGFAAATYLRGISFIQIPTTLLSQSDSSVGGKTGVDFDGYKNMVKTTEGNNTTKDITETWTPAQKALWDKLTSQYHGNLMLIDFWGIPCGPCRQGMLNMRKNVEELKNEKIKFLYVCNETDSPRDKAEKWMSESKINGEHIYVTQSEWTLLQAMFNFTAIPRTALIGRDGKIIQYKFDVYLNIGNLKELLNKF